uniref:Pyridoxal phosphate homeostasis protein n=1 Tax=Vagococcus elongatus TaxID=180344 RepID=A0A430AYB9_9ENTE|nr:YggS family pyridoxal phosphate-dependent enzyme [Vagococcus elongatus]RSU13062.1 YggS family pyridoxal phosphate enzyme [Vagococcus elongatus]
MLEENLKVVKTKIDQALQRAPKGKNVTLVAVTKSVTSARAKELVELGVVDLAENRAENLLEKQHQLQDQHELTWHLIGTLQTRKIKDIINDIDYFHALDRLKTAKEIQKRSKKVIKCFVQVNVSGETTKQGISLDGVKEFIEDLEKFDKIQVVGLMTMAPLGEPPETIRKYFRQLADKQKDIAELNLPYAPCTELSMGMSNDFEIAVEEGATFVRIGTSLFENHDEEGEHK